MKRTIAVLSDIHANHFALEAALRVVADVHPDNLLFLGDYVTDCPYPQKTMALLAQARETYSCGFIRGNREDYLLARRSNPDNGWQDSSSTGSLLYTYRNLTSDDLDFFASMPICADYTFHDCPTLTACHATPFRSKEWMPGNESLLCRSLRAVRGNLLLCGHTHGAAEERRFGKTALFCPSVGIPQDRGNSYGVTVLTCENSRWAYEMLPVSYDIDAAVAEFSESGLLELSKVWALCIIGDLREKRNYAASCVRIAWRIAKESGYTGNGPLPESCWVAAAEELRLL